MKISTTTYDFRKFFGNDHVSSIRCMYDTGFRYIDLSMSMVEENDALIIREDWQETVKKLKQFAAGLGMEFVQAHSPCSQKTSKGSRTVNPFASKQDYDLYMQWNIRSVEVCAELEIPNIVVHPGLSLRSGKEAFMEENKVFYRELLAATEHLPVNILTENASRTDFVTNPHFQGKFQCWTGQEMRELIELVDHPLFHACWDIAHRSMDGGNQYEDFVAMGEHLYALHLADNRGPGYGHEHLVPFCGTVNFDDIMAGLKACNYKGYFNYEAANTIRPGAQRRNFDGEDRLKECPLELEMAMEKYKYQVGKYILESYNCFEE